MHPTHSAGRAGLHKTLVLSSAAAAALTGALSAPAWAQEEPSRSSGATAIIQEEVVVTATKRNNVAVQDVPIAMTALNEGQIEALKVSDLTSLSYNMPNVALDTQGSAPGFANFSIRGLGVSGSTISIEPTVGVFVDGLYQGVPAGINHDNFDLAGIEVLRGPQGILFGRNVVGGALLLRTTDPTFELTGNLRYAIENGPNQTYSGVISGPITDTVALKFGAFINDDNGLYEDAITGVRVPTVRTEIYRPALRWQPNDDFNLTIKYEDGKSGGLSPQVQSTNFTPRGSFRFANGPSYGRFQSEWQQATVEANWHVPFGDGTITSITGWRQYQDKSTLEADGLPALLFAVDVYIDQDQFSSELRYAGTFGSFDVTTGIIYFTQDIFGREIRTIFTGAGYTTPSGGGQQTTTSYGLFAAADWHFTDTLTLNMGARYSQETKEARIARIRVGGCNIPTTCTYTFPAPGTTDDGEESWDDLSPRVGLQWKPNNDLQVYASYTRGFRSGGYNLRQSSFAVPGPYQPERQDAFEVGVKSDFMDGRGRLNLAVFYTDISNLQRTVLRPSGPGGGAGLTQTVTNAANAAIQGFELDGRFALFHNFVLTGAVGYIDAGYEEVIFDLNNDGVINQKDYNLHLTRAAPWSYSLSAVYDHEVGIGTLSTRVAFSHRDEAYWDDGNLAKFRPADLWDADITLNMPSGVSLSLYGRNLTDEVTESAISATSFGGAGGLLSNLNKGRTYGAEIRYRF